MIDRATNIVARVSMKVLPSKLADKVTRVFWRRKVRQGCVAISDIMLALDELGLNRAAKRKYWAWHRSHPEACWDFLSRHYTKS